MGKTYNEQDNYITARLLKDNHTYYTIITIKVTQENE